MKKISWLIMGLILALTACTPLKQAQIKAARGLAGSVTKQVGAHEVYCSEGKVCAEVEVLAINAEPKDDGLVTVTFKNQTGNTALVQARLQMRDPAAVPEIVAESKPRNIAIPPTQEITEEWKGYSKKNTRVRVLLNTAH